MEPHGANREDLQVMLDEENLLGFLREENEEIKNEFEYLQKRLRRHGQEGEYFCRDILDFELLWKHSASVPNDFLNSQNIFGLHTILSIPLNKSNYEKMKRNDKDHNGCFKVRVSADSNTIFHDFANGSLEITLNFEVECISNLYQY